eukprot:1190976-Prorocentrum_minimum.AAC.1
MPIKPLSSKLTTGEFNSPVSHNLTCGARKQRFPAEHHAPQAETGGRGPTPHIWSSFAKAYVISETHCTTVSPKGTVDCDATLLHSSARQNCLLGIDLGDKLRHFHGLRFRRLNRRGRGGGIDHLDVTHERYMGVTWMLHVGLFEDAPRASMPTTDRESRRTSDDQRRRHRAPTLNY